MLYFLLRRIKRRLKNDFFCFFAKKSLNTVYVFGDSHGTYCFRKLIRQHINLSCNAITMHRVGRDGIPFFCSRFCHPSNVFIFCYGEIDCRNHVARQLEKGRSLQDITRLLVDSYFERIARSVSSCSKIIVCSLPPPAKFSGKLEPLNQKFFPHAGSDQDRLIFTKKINSLICEASLAYGFGFLDLFCGFEDSSGFLLESMSDGICHIVHNDLVLERLVVLLDAPSSLQSRCH